MSLPGASRTRRWLALCAALLAHAAPAHAQGSAAPPPGVVEGDVYLTMQSGEVRRMAGRSVYLLPDSAIRPWAPACEARDSSRTRYVRLRRPARLAYEEVRAARAGERAARVARADSARAAAFAALEPARRVESDIVAWIGTQRAAQTGASGHYAFEGVAPGEYALYADADLPYLWLVPVRVAPGRQTRDLANRDMLEAQFDRAATTAASICSRAELLSRPPAVGSGEGDDLTDEQPPVLANRSDVTRALTRRYPRALRGTGGSVTVRFRIAADGAVDAETVEAVRATVAESVRGEVESAAEMVVESMRFSPATVNGRAVAVWVVQPIFFTPETE